MVDPELVLVKICTARDAQKSESLKMHSSQR